MASQVPIPTCWSEEAGVPFDKCVSLRMRRRYPGREKRWDAGRWHRCDAHTPSAVGDRADIVIERLSILRFLRQLMPGLAIQIE